VCVCACVRAFVRVLVD